MTWNFFENHFKKKYLNVRYYGEKEKEFNDLKLGKMIIEEFVTKFASLDEYVDYLKEEKENI